MSAMLHERWVDHVLWLYEHGEQVGPRGQGTREVLNDLFEFRAEGNLLDVPSRKLNFRFAVAEFVWMIFGRSDVESLAHYNSVMRQFSDDGLSLTGAYGPHIAAQIWRVTRKLIDDPDTRQAVVTIPRPQVYNTKDEPCTMALQFIKRYGQLHCIASMRSSDAWLGIPYDAFTFSSIQRVVAGIINTPVGNCSINMGSAHLYDRDRGAAFNMMQACELRETISMPPLPGMPPHWLEGVLIHHDMRDVPASELDRPSPWLPYAEVLGIAKTSEEARNILLAESLQGV